MKPLRAEVLPVVAAGDGDRAATTAVVPVDPRRHLPPAGEVNPRLPPEVETPILGGRIVSLLAVQDGEEPRRAEAIHLAANQPAVILDRAGIAIQVQEAAPRGSRLNEVGSACDQVMQREPAHEGAIDKEEVGAAAHCPG